MVILLHSAFQIIRLRNSAYHLYCTFPVFFSNACGQLGQSYQDYKCSASEAHMECPVKADMEITATTNAKWWGAPAPLFCAPKSKHPFTGFWDHSKECNKPWANPPEYCESVSSDYGSILL